MTAEGEQEAVRVLLIVSRNNPYWSQSWLSTEDVFSVAITAIREACLVSKEESEAPIRLLVKQKWPLRVLIVFDIFHNNYSVELGHLPEHNDLPVLVVYFGAKGVNARAADRGIQIRVNKDTGNAHNVNGEHSMPPFVEDHTSSEVPLYLNPRDPSLL